MSMTPALPARLPVAAKGVVVGSSSTWPLVLDMLIATSAV
jgi:hypothetical protein